MSPLFSQRGIILRRRTIDLTAAVDEENQTNPRIPLKTEEEANFGAPSTAVEERRSDVHA